MDETIKALEKR